MVNINYNRNEFRAEGHSQTTVCAMFTALTVSLVDNVCVRLGQNMPHILDMGVFNADTTHIHGKARELYRAYIYAVEGLAKSYPDHFTINK